MQKKLLGFTSVDFNVIGQRLIRSISVIYWKKWEYNGTVHQLFIDFKELGGKYSKTSLIRSDRDRKIGLRIT
jgi:hypothetical protein